MSLARFLSALFEHGRPRVGHPAGERSSAAIDPEAAQQLAACERSLLGEFPGRPPNYLPVVGQWAARLTYRLSQLLAYRDLGPELINSAVHEPCPIGPAADVAWSADVTLRFLPDLHRLASAVSAEDPLTVAIVELACKWPLSSVGIRVEKLETLGDWADHPGLLRLYRDRILKKQAVDRLVDPRVRAAAVEGIGDYPQLAPAVAKALAEPVGSHP